jgi:hypothetical protein
MSNFLRSMEDLSPEERENHRKMTERVIRAVEAERNENADRPALVPKPEALQRSKR